MVYNEAMKILRFTSGDEVSRSVRMVQTVYILVFLGMAGIGALWVLSAEVLQPDIDPLLQVIAVTILLALLSFTAGLLTHDYSWTDRLWSTAPVGLAWIYVIAADWDTRVLVAAVLVTLWGARLTFNFARRGGYSGMEDYRWAILHSHIRNPLAWQLFNLVFIAGFQHLLFIGFTLPLYVLYLERGSEPGLGFWLGCAALLYFLMLETIADQQQWEFQKRKSAAKVDAESAQTEVSEAVDPSTDEDLRRGFLSTGLFRWSRHPNYLGELGVWWSVYFLGAIAAGSLLHWSIVGPALLSCLFVGSTRFTEKISASKYPGYREYQKTTWPILPRPW